MFAIIALGQTGRPGLRSVSCLAATAVMLLWCSALGCAGHARLFDRSAESPIVIGTERWTTTDGPVVGHWAVVDLTDPRVEIVVTDPIAEVGEGEESDLLRDTDTEAHLKSTLAWALEQDLVLAVNANFFGLTSSAPKELGYANGSSSDIIGLSVSDGQVVSPARRVRHQVDPSLIVLASGRARIGRFAEDDLMLAHDPIVDAVAGVGASAPASPDDPVPAVSLLVTAGANTGAESRVAPQRRHPRTAVGVNQAGDRLILLVVDGRRPGYSVGMTLPELADAMMALGAWDAINLDGGGSSSFVALPGGLESDHGDEAASNFVKINRPSGGMFRPVANHLGIRLRAMLP